MKVSIVAAMADPSRAIGLGGGLPWKLPADLARFKQLTMGHTLVMGRSTWEPIRARGLPGRRIIVLSRSGFPAGEGYRVAGSLSEALRLAGGDSAESEVFIAGGAQVYRAALEQAVVDRMYLTVVHAAFEADTFFPPYAEQDWVSLAVERRPPDAANSFPLTFTILERRPSA